VNDLGRSANFTYVDKDSTYYDGIDMYTYELDPNLMINMEKNPDNVLYNTVYDGSSNLTTVLTAPVLATKGHFYQF
jgi:hypothetical protein